MNARVKSVASPDDRVEIAVAPTPVEIRSRFVTAVVLRIAGPVDEAFFAALDRLLAQAPHFFVKAPIVLDLERAHGFGGKAEFLTFARKLRSRSLSAIGVQNCSPEQAVEASAAGLVALPRGGDRPVERDPAATAAPDHPETAPATMLVTEPVRSGQRIFADRGDLIVVAPVSSGAELIAHGSIHIYGRLRGRALAGVNGDAAARIFCQRLEPELIAVAGLYKTSEDLGPAFGKRAQAFLENDTLRVEPLG